jgi:hypothetical protein
LVDAPEDITEREAMCRDSTIGGRLLRAGIVGLCVLLGGCGSSATTGAKSNAHASPAVADFHYSVLERPGANGISVIAPTQVPAAKLTPAHPIWVTLPASHTGGAARPIISSARELVHEGPLRVWLSENMGGGICMLGFNPRRARDPKHDHSLLVSCGSERTSGEGGLIEEAWAHGSQLVVGAVPDGVRVVVLHLANGEHREVAVAGNAYHVVVPAHVAEVTFSGET